MGRNSGTARNLYNIATKVPEELFNRLDRLQKRMAGRSLYDGITMASVLRQCLEAGVEAVERREDAIDEIRPEAAVRAAEHRRKVE